MKTPAHIRPETVPFDEIAEAILEVSKLGTRIKQSKLKEKAILVLLSNATGLSQTIIKQVLDELPLLQKNYLK